MKRICFLLIFFHSCIYSFSQQKDLDYFIGHALISSPELSSYQNQLLSSGIDSMLLLASTKTRVDFVSSNYYAPVVAGVGYDEAITNIAQVQALVQVTKNFLSKGNLSAQYQTIALQSRALRDSMLLSKRELIKTIADQYVTAYGDLLTLDYSKELYELLVAGQSALKKLAEASVIKQTEYLLYAITVQQQELTYLQAEVQYNSDYLTLNFLSGIVDTTITRIPEPVFPESMVYDIYNTVPYKKYETDSLRIVNQRKLIDYSYRPVIDAFADAGFNSSLQMTPYKNYGYSFGVNVKIPLYDSRLKRLKYQKLDLEENNRLYNKQFFVAQYQQRVLQLRNQLQSTERLFGKIQNQVDYTLTLIRAYEKLLQTGDVKVSELITAITNYINVQNTLRQNKVSRWKVISDINYWTY